MGVVVVVGVTTAYHYDGWGNLIQQSSQGLITDFVLDERGDLPVVLGELRSNGSSTIYAYGPDGVAAQPTSRTDQIGQATRTTSYSYDGLERPTQVSNPEGAGGTAISYDANGRLIGDGARTYRYDARDRLVQVLGTGGADYRYNGDGALVGQTVGGTSTDYAQDVGAPLSEVLQARQGSTTTNYLYGTERFGALAGSTRTEELHDTLGSTCLTTDAAGNAQTALRFDPYGRPLSGTQPQPFGFTGEMQKLHLLLHICVYHLIVPESLLYPRFQLFLPLDTSPILAYTAGTYHLTSSICSTSSPTAHCPCTTSSNSACATRSRGGAGARAR